MRPNRRAIDCETAIPTSSEQEADLVVVGAGTAGCVVASRVARSSDASVIMLEAGREYPRILDIPLVGLWASLRRPSRYYWNQSTVPQDSLGGRSLWFPTGRVCGGSSSVNAMIYCRGHPRSYDRWDVDGWRYHDLAPFFRRSETFEGGSSPHHGAEGPIGIGPGRFRHRLGLAFIEGCKALGIPANDDFNGASAEGAGFYHRSQRNGRRSSTVAYLATTGPSSRLRVVTGTLVTRVVVAGGRAVGVEILRGRQREVVRARRQVVLCGGAVKTPQLLQLSGIGPAQELEHLGIRVVADRPEVGANLQDHIRVPVVFRVDGPRYTALSRLLAAGPRYLLQRRGLLTSGVADVAAIVRTGLDTEVPDVRVVLAWRTLPERPETLVSLETGLIDPHSRGHVRLRSADPTHAPDIDPGYLQLPADLERLRNGVALARRIAATPACRSAGVREEFMPGPRSDVVEHIRQTALSSFHPAGTCRLGTDEASVVDEALRVRGVEGLRVVDGSVMPTTVTGNAMAPVLAIAERGAELILKSLR